MLQALGFTSLGGGAAYVAIRGTPGAESVGEPGTDAAYPVCTGVGPGAAVRVTVDGSVDIGNVPPCLEKSRQIEATCLA